MSPEQSQGKPCDGRADLYSLGATLYHMLSGQVPFPASTRREIRHFVRHLRAHVDAADLEAAWRDAPDLFFTRWPPRCFRCFGSRCFAASWPRSGAPVS